ncbi:hypothetical protein BC792_1255 [Sphingobacterium allocomposti]|uniref:Uncharacterized protein n=1 Tax=Sphingobacterium allocomposti TaxID=415956 RepID=A0A5S5D658_9SPHI|nr:hypothetical protein BC792_1255 [Sphingobacterium composti Yoo et al. 2007 non Ten et al. 2007]
MTYEAVFSFIVDEGSRGHTEGNSTTNLDGGAAILYSFRSKSAGMSRNFIR